MSGLKFGALLAITAVALASLAYTFSENSIVLESDKSKSSSVLSVPKGNSEHRKLAHFASLTAISAPYSDKGTVYPHVRRRIQHRQRTIVDANYRSWLKANNVNAAPLPPREVPHFLPRIYRHKIVQPHLPSHELRIPCTSGCEWMQSRALKAAEGLVELAKRSHDAREEAQRNRQTADEKVIRSLRAKLSHILPDPTGRCLSTKQCADCEVCLRSSDLSRPCSCETLLPVLKYGFESHSSSFCSEHTLA